MSQNLYDITVAKIDKTQTTIGEFQGKVLLIVNVASKCGFTPQYEGLEALYKKYRDRGLEILGFPCNQFGEQEPGSEEEIVQFCKLTYDVSFPMFAKVDVNGDDRHPLYTFLTKEAKGFLGSKDIKWNFTKFLVDKNGKVIDRYGSVTKPQELEKDIEKLL